MAGRSEPHKTEGIQMREYNGNFPSWQVGVPKDSFLLSQARAPKAKEASNKDLGVFKLVAGLVSVGCLVIESVFYIAPSSNSNIPDNYANMVSNLGPFHPPTTRQTSHH